MFIQQLRMALEVIHTIMILITYMHMQSVSQLHNHIQQALLLFNVIMWPDLKLMWWER